jgi:hypothetical protein
MFVNHFSTRTIVLVSAAIALMTLLPMTAYLEQRSGEETTLISPQQAPLDHDHNAQLVSQNIHPDTYFPLPPGKQTALDNTGISDSQVLRDLAEVRLATDRYHDVNVALADGFIRTPYCVEEPRLGAMGIHFINRARLMDPAINLLEPEILLYIETKYGMKLLGVEYFQGIGAPDTAVPNPAPPAAVVLGRPLDGPMEHHEPGQPPHYDLHVWVWQANPTGIFEPFNPNVSCQ